MKPVIDQPNSGEGFDWTGVMAAVATGVIFLLATAHGPNIYFTLGAFCFWIIFIAIRVRRDRNTLERWGFRTDNLRKAALIPVAVFIVAALAFAAYALARHRFQFPLHVLPLFLIYPLWAVIQQFLVLGIVVGNLAKIESLNRRPVVLVLLGTLVFGGIHLPDPILTVGTTALALLYVPLFLRDRNVLPLGVVHGWIGTLFYLWVLGRDVWAENCCSQFFSTVRVLRQPLG
jgi:hypothetical protein